MNTETRQKARPRIVLLLCMVMALCGFSSQALADDQGMAEWTIGIYMCGTDLEARDGSATLNILQMIEADIPDNVNIIMLTGGTKEWDPTDMGAGYPGAYVEPDASQSQLWRMDDDGMKLIKNYEEQFDMGSPETLSMFLETVLTDYPSKRVMLSLWDHGGGPLGGVAVDDYTRNSLKLSDLTNALSEAMGNAGREKLDLIGFDACLMSGMEIAANLAPYADYMVASADFEPGQGWHYTYWLDDLSEAGGNMEGDDLGRAIVDAYAYSENDSGDWANVKELTLAVVDLSRIDEVVKAFDEMAFELSTKVLSDDELFATVLRLTEKVDNMYDPFGLLDLYDFAYMMSPYLNSAQALMTAIGAPPGTNPENFVGEIKDGAVLYRGTGVAHHRGVGLTFYYPTSKTLLGTGSDEQAANAAYLYRNMGVSDFYTTYLYNTLTAVTSLQEFKEELVIKFEDENYQLHLADTIAVKNVEYITTQLLMGEDGEEDIHLYLGKEPTNADWEAGIFSDYFDGRWYTVGGNLATSISEFIMPNLVQMVVPVVIDDSDTLSIMSVYMEVTDDNEIVDAVIGSIITPTDDEASRSFLPDASTKIYTVLLEFDPETVGIGEQYYISDTPLDLGEADEGGYFMVDIDAIDLDSGQDRLNTCYFVVTDVRGNQYLSEPCPYVIINDLSEMTVEKIADQPYTGSEIKPKVHLTFMGEDNLLREGVDYEVRYFDNVAKGTARIEITPLTDDLSGTLTVHFDIVG